MGINITEMVSIKKFTNYHLKKWENGKRKINGSFKEKGSNEIIKGDIFDCLNINNNALESYKCAVAYFNYTRPKGEEERIVVSAKWEEEKEE